MLLSFKKKKKTTNASILKSIILLSPKSQNSDHFKKVTVPDFVVIEEKYLIKQAFVQK